MEITEIKALTAKYSSRNGAAITEIVLHDTAGLMPGCLDWLRIDRTGTQDDVSAHILIDRDGNIYRMVEDDKKAWHCIGHNARSLGLEMERANADDSAEWPPRQLASASIVVANWAAKFTIPLNRIYSHAELDPTRRTDPRNFPWYDFLISVGVELKLNHNRS